MSGYTITLTNTEYDALKERIAKLEAALTTIRNRLRSDPADFETAVGDVQFSYHVANRALTASETDSRTLSQKRGDAGYQRRHRHLPDDDSEPKRQRMIKPHQSQLMPAENKFHVGNGADAKHYWLTPPALMHQLTLEFGFDFDPAPYPLPEGFDGLTCDWGQSNYVNPPFGSIIHQGKKKGPTSWARKAILEASKGKRVVLVYPIDKWVLMLLAAGAEVRNLGDVRWCATEDGSQGKGTGRHIAAFILNNSAPKTKAETFVEHGK